MSRAAADGRAGGAQRLQQGADVEEIGGLLLGGLGDAGARVVAGGDKPFGLQGSQRLTDRHSGNAVPAARISSISRLPGASAPETMSSRIAVHTA